MKEISKLSRVILNANKSKPSKKGWRYSEKVCKTLVCSIFQNKDTEQLSLFEMQYVKRLMWANELMNEGYIDIFSD